MLNLINVKTGSGRVFSGSGIWTKYGAGFGKTQNILTGNGICLLPGSGIHQNLGTGCAIFFARLSEIREVVRSSDKCEVQQASVLLAMKKSEVGNDYIIETIKWSTDERIEDLQFQADARKAHMVFNDLVLMSSIAQALYIYCITWRDTLIH